MIGYQERENDKNDHVYKHLAPNFIILPFLFNAFDKVLYHNIKKKTIVYISSSILPLIGSLTFFSFVPTVSTSSGEYRDQIPATVPECDLQDRSGLDTTMTYDLPGNRGHMMQHHAGFAPMHAGMNPRPQMGRPRIRPTSESSIEDANAPPAPKKRGRRLGQGMFRGSAFQIFFLMKLCLHTRSDIGNKFM